MRWPLSGWKVFAVGLSGIAAAPEMPIPPRKLRKRCKIEK